MQPETRNTIRKNNKILMKGLRVITSEAPSWQPSSEHSLSSPKIKHSNEYLKSPKNLHIFCTSNHLKMHLGADISLVYFERYTKISIADFYIPKR